MANSIFHSDYAPVPEPPKSKGRRPTGAIVIALVVLALVLVVAFLMGSRDGAKPATANQTQTR